MRHAVVAALVCMLCACGASTEEVRLSWDEVPGNEIAGYNVYRSEEPGAGYRRINDEPLSEPEYVDTDVERGKTYYYRVTSVNTAGLESEFSEERSKTVD